MGTTESMNMHQREGPTMEWDEEMAETNKLDHAYKEA